MDFKFSKDSSNTPQEAPDDKKKQSALLVLLLILVGGFTYIYFFTGLIKPQEASKNAAPAPAPAVKTEVAKLPLPPREGEPAKAEVKAAEKVAPAAAAAPAPAAAKPAPAPAVKPAVAPPKAAPVVKASAPKEEPKKAEVKPADKKPLPVAVVKDEDKKPLPATNKAAKNSVPAKTGVKKPTAETQAKADTEAKPNKAASDPWSIIIGNYVLEEVLSADMGRIRKAGFQPVVKASTRKKTTMHRLLLAEFSDRASAQPTLDKIKQQTSDAFVIEQGGKFAIIAGSYLQTEAAQSEKERLQGAGFAVTIKQVDIAIPSQALSVGPFTSKKAADSAIAKLKSSGIKASLSQK
jgi:cell division septation protein DedD